MQGYEKNEVKTRRDFTWTYYVSRGDESLTPIMLIHGWPDHAQMFEGIVKYLRQFGVKNTIILPDVLGFDGSSKPTNPAVYRYDALSEDIVDILEAQKIPKIIVGGHDWGSVIAQRFYNFRPDRVTAILLLNGPYMAPSKEKFDLDAVNAMTEQMLGYPAMAYWSLFTAPDGPQILKDNVGRLFSALHAAGSDSMQRFFCTPGAIRTYLLAPPGAPEDEVKDYAKDPAFRQAFIDRMRRDGFEAPQCCYLAPLENAHREAESQLSEERCKVNVPLLYIGCTEDAVCRPEFMAPAKLAGMLPDLEEPKLVESGHWCPYEKPEEVAKIMAEYLLRRFPARND